SIAWRHFASQTSGYGLIEKPGQAYSYNDFALALYYDTLTQKVFGTNGTEVLRTRLGEPLQFEDHYSFSAFNKADREGRLAISVRDFARFGLLYLRGGQWRGSSSCVPSWCKWPCTVRCRPTHPAPAARRRRCFQISARSGARATSRRPDPAFTALT